MRHRLLLALSVVVTVGLGLAYSLYAQAEVRRHRRAPLRGGPGGPSAARPAGRFGECNQHRDGGAAGTERLARRRRFARPAGAPARPAARQAAWRSSRCSASQRLPTRQRLVFTQGRRLRIVRDNAPRLAGRGRGCRASATLSQWPAWCSRFRRRRSDQRAAPPRRRHRRAPSRDSSRGSRSRAPRATPTSSPSAPAPATPPRRPPWRT